MNTQFAGLDTYIIHFTPLRARLDKLLASDFWPFLFPRVITEHCTINIMPQNIKDTLCALDAACKAEIMAQLLQISNILAYHEDLYCGNRQVSPLATDHIDFSMSKKMIHNLYCQALGSLSSKNTQLTMQHLSALEIFLESSSDYCLVLEDDSGLLTKSKQELWFRIKEVLDEVKLLGTGFYDVSDSLGFRPHLSNGMINREFVQMGCGQTRCASSYIVTRDTASVLISNKCRIFLPVDWHYSYMLNLHKIPTYWSTNPIFNQGSQTGELASNHLERNSG